MMMEQTMQEMAQTFHPELADLSRGGWLARLEDLAEEAGYFEPVGPRHSAVFIDDGPTLLVTFENVDDIRRRSAAAEPLGFELVRTAGWSHLCILADGRTWYRDDTVYRYMDRLVDEGFFEDFDQVVFYGEGMGGYGATAFSVVAPGATVIALRPQATLDPRITGWDNRFMAHRRLSFRDRYGYGPDMIDAAERAFILYDPHVRIDAMHAALFNRPNVSLIRCPHMGGDLEVELRRMQVLYRILSRAGKGTLTDGAIHLLLRARRHHMPYMRSLLAHVEDLKRPYLSALLCRAMLKTKHLPKVRNRLDELQKEGVPVPAPEAVG